MGIDLALLPIEFDGGTWGYSHSALTLDRDSALFDKILKLHDAGPVPLDFTSYIGGRVPDGSHEGESCYGQTHEDPYGAEIRTVLAGDLGKLKQRGSKRNAAVLAYCKALAPETRVALYWR